VLGRIEVVSGAICYYEIVFMLLQNSIAQSRFYIIGSKFISVWLCSTHPCVIRMNHFHCPFCPRSSPSPSCFNSFSLSSNACVKCSIETDGVRMAVA
jgi:hypothetical protein